MSSSILINDAMRPTPRDDEKVLPLLKKFGAVGDEAGISWILDTPSGENVRVVDIEHHTTY